MTSERYEINGKTYIQRPMVLGQVKQLVDAMQGVVIPPGAGVADIAGILGDRLANCAAAVLQPEGVQHKDKDIKAMSAEFSEHLDLEQADKIIDDFFALTPARAFTRLMAKMQIGFAGMRLGMSAPESIKSSVSLPQET